MDALRARVKRQLLSNKYCRFVLVHKILPDEVLLNDKPAVIFNELRYLAGERAGELKPKAFYAWLSRYRKKRKKADMGIVPSVANQVKDWRQFEPPSLADSGSQVEKVSIEFIKPI